MANRVARRSGRFIRGVSGTRRESLWLFVGPTTTITISAGGVAVIGFALNAAALALRPFTVVRQRYFWYVRSDVVTGGEVYGGAVGSCVVSDQAVAIGVTAVPTPITDQGSDLWSMLEQQFGRFGGTAVEDVGKSMNIDSRAMRKVEDGEDFVVTFETGASTESLSMISVFGGRALIKLH